MENSFDELHTAMIQGLFQTVQQQQELLASMVARVTKDEATPKPVTRKKRNLDAPRLEPPSSIDFVAFPAWQRRWADYVTMTCVLEEVPDTTGRQAVLRTALDDEWTTLWVTGRLGIECSDDTDVIQQKLYSYLRRCRSPLQDRQRFHARNQEEGEDVDHYLACLSQVYDACAYELDMEMICRDASIRTTFRIRQKKQDCGTD